MTVMLPSKNNEQCCACRRQIYGKLGPLLEVYPFKNSKLRLAGSPRSVVEKLSPGFKTPNHIDDWLANPYNAHSIARGRPAIYMKRSIIKYIEIFITASNAYFYENTLKSIPLAL